jgi:hypothetical protein
MYDIYPDMDMGFGGDEAFGVTFLLIYLFYFLIIGLVSLATYVLTSWGTYSIAKRRGIRNPWLAWIPVGNVWILGCISDQYRYVAKGQVKNKRKALLVLNILLYIALIVMLVLCFVLIFQMISSGFGHVQPPMGTDAFEESVIGSMVGLLVVYLVMLGVSVAFTILQYMALYDLYASCDPSNKVLYLVLNIFVSITLPIFIFICRNQDLGMPPKKAEEPVAPVEPEPAWLPQPEEPWNNE